jgi:membrane-bound lytic murein transglycosylase MltF
MPIPYSKVARGRSFLLACLISVFLLPRAEAVESLLQLDKKWIGDFDGMLERQIIRVLVPYSKTFYFLDGADQRGLTYELTEEFEKFLNRRHQNDVLRIKLVIIPTRRDRLLAALNEGIGDIAAGNLTITDERSAIVDFSSPILNNVDEILVSGPTSPKIATIDDLAGKEIHVRESSSYYESLISLNERFEREGKESISLVKVDDLLEDEDLLELMNAKLYSFIIMDNHKAEFWAQIFKELTLHPDVKVRTGGRIAWAFRKNSPKLETIVNEFISRNKKGTAIGNILFRRYLKSTKFVHNILNEEEFERFALAVDSFRKYAREYNFDWLMITALAYQESRLDQSKVSPEGAIGIMQLLPSTARDPNVNIPNIEKIENNIHAGVKYLRFISDRYYTKDSIDPFNRLLFSFASYNAGPSKILRLRQESKLSGFDPNVWFRNVEIIAAKRIGRETVQYVSNIYKYYTAYRLVMEKVTLKKALKKEKLNM